MIHVKPALPLFLLFSAGASAQAPPETDLAAVQEARAEAEEDALSVTDADIEQRAQVDRLTVENAMRQIETSSDHDLGDQLPLPQLTGYDDILAALQYRSAWRRTDRSGAAHDEYKDALATLPHFGGQLYYREWSCGTGGEIAVARQAADLYRQLVTTYPERLMLRAFLDERELLGYPTIRQCDYDALKQIRRTYQERLSIILG